MIILGIDPALSNLGWGVIEVQSNRLSYIASGVISTKSTQLMYKRLAFIAAKLELIIERHNPEILAMEESFINMNAVSSMKLGYIRGVIMAIAGKRDLEFKEFKPNFVKKTVVGSGHAEKHQLLHMIKILFPNITDKIVSTDESDAIAVAYTCHAATSSLKIRTTNQ